MTFEEILDQALDMLRRRGRVTYGALKRQFGLDDAYEPASCVNRSVRLQNISRSCGTCGSFI